MNKAPCGGVRADTRQIPLSSPYLDEREEELVLEVLRSGRLSLGPAIDRFEQLFAETVGAPYAAAVSSGTAGLHLLAALAGFEAGDEVITSPYSFVASANCFIYEGATPVFADIDERTMNLDPATVEAAITERTKGIVAVDIFGYPCELDPLRELAERHDLVLIQDACEALGAEYKGRAVGAQGVDAVFAFYPNKQLTTGEGGIVTTDSEETRARSSASETRAAPMAAAGSTTPGSASTTASTTSARRSGSASSRSSTRSWRFAARLRSAIPTCLRMWRGSTFRWPTTPTMFAPGSSTWSRSRGAPTGNA